MPRNFTGKLATKITLKPFQVKPGKPINCNFRQIGVIDNIKRFNFYFAQKRQDQ
jgi:hypothetical protein